MKRFAVPFLAVLSLLVPLTASAQMVGVKYEWEYRDVMFRNTSAATGSVLQDLLWSRGGVSPTGFVDSTVARRAGANAVGAPDTTIAYNLRDFKIPDTGRKGATALVDTATTIWLEIEGSQDTTSYSFNAATVMDSMHVAAQYSYDGINWLGANGTPTVAFSAEAPIPANPTDGIAPQVINSAEVNPAAENIRVFLKCDPHTSVVGAGAYIINRSLCMCGAKYVRFLIGFPGGGGQFRARIGYWKEVELQGH